MSVVAYCLMENHFHLLLRQESDDGISRFMSDWTNSFVRFFNHDQKRSGCLLEGRFKAVLVEDNEQLTHVNRYIHMNPFTGFLVRKLEDLIDYPWSSLADYLGEEDNSRLRVDDRLVMSLFESRQKYREFVFDQASYQRELGKVKRLALEDLRGVIDSEVA